MNRPERPPRPASTYPNLAAASLAGQIGCLTLLFIGVALVAGLWLDNRFDTRPIFTLILIFASMPVTLYVVYRVALSAAKRMQRSIMPGRPESKKETDIDA